MCAITPSSTATAGGGSTSRGRTRTNSPATRSGRRGTTTTRSSTGSTWTPRYCGRPGRTEGGAPAKPQAAARPGAQGEYAMTLRWVLTTWVVLGAAGAAPAAEYRDLFNGKDLDGWVVD